MPTASPPPSPQALAAVSRAVATTSLLSGTFDLAFSGVPAGTQSATPPEASGAVDFQMSVDVPAVRTEQLTKRLRNGIVAVEHLDLAVEHLDLAVGQGRVLGLVGPNGSGKTITLRILLGLVRPTSGRALLFGQEVRPGAAVLGRVGALVDGPGFVPHRLCRRRNHRPPVHPPDVRDRAGLHRRRRHACGPPARHRPGGRRGLGTRHGGRRGPVAINV